MDTRLSEDLGRKHVKIIGIFYLISGAWEYLQAVHSLGGLPLTAIHDGYVTILGAVTFLVGIGILYRMKAARISALILAWWNIFTAPLFDIWWYVYIVCIKKALLGSPLSFYISYTVILFLVLTFVRLYIIRTLKFSRAGYIFLKDKNKFQATS